MITKWKVSNFKSIREDTELALGPLTIFAGANSSGKSTFIQSILLVAQTLAHKVDSRSVVLNGALTSLGQFDDLKSNDSESKQITIGCTCRPLSERKKSLASISRRTSHYYPWLKQFQKIDCELSFDADPSSSQRDEFQVQPRLFATQLSCTIRDEDNVDQEAKISIRRSDKNISETDGIGTISERDESVLASMAYEVDLDDSSMAEMKEDFMSAQPIGCVMRHFLSERITCEIDTIEEDANEIARVLTSTGRRSVRYRSVARREFLLTQEIIAVLQNVLEGIIDFDELFDYQGMLPGMGLEGMRIRTWHKNFLKLSYRDQAKVRLVLSEKNDLPKLIYEAMRDSNISSSESHRFVQVRPPHFIAEATDYLDDFFTSSLKYLGPLRDAPKPLYPLTPAADPYDVGLRGEHTASILDLHKNKKIEYIPSANFEFSLIDRRTVIRNLDVAVVDWLKYLDVAKSVKSRDQGKLGHELKVALFNSDSTHDLTHVGVGVSQVLPILVMGLLADTDSTLVFEQPELHLHPKVQTLLGDFFLSMALCNKQCIVETHSEYFIDRLRFRIAAASSENELNNQAKIYFVEKPAQSSSFREVMINEYGAIPDWPEGFFDQSQEQAEEILRAAAKKRKASRKEDR